MVMITIIVIIIIIIIIIIITITITIIIIIIINIIIIIILSSSLLPWIRFSSLGPSPTRRCISPPSSFPRSHFLSVFKR